MNEKPPPTLIEVSLEQEQSPTEKAPTNETESRVSDNEQKEIEEPQHPSVWGTIEQMEKSREETEQSLNEVRVKLGISAPAEKPPSIVAIENKMARIRAEEEAEFSRELQGSFRGVGDSVNELEQTLRRSGQFFTPRLEGDVLHTTISESGIDFNKTSDFFENLAKKIGRDFTTEDGDGRRRPMIDSQAYRYVIGALENLENSLRNIKAKLDNRKIPSHHEEYEDLSKKVTRALIAGRDNQDFLKKLYYISYDFEQRR